MRCLGVVHPGGMRWAGVLVGLAMQAMAGAVAAAPSDTRPFWTERAMFRFGDELYFVGVASCAKTSEAGRQAAFVSGMRELSAYARDRETSRLWIDTAMIYEEPNAAHCPASTTSVWRLLRVNQATMLELPRRKPQVESPEDKEAGGSVGPSETWHGSVAHAPVQDLTPKPGMSREHIAQRFGQPTQVTKQGQEEIWEYGDTGLSITFSPNETLVSWTLVGTPDRSSVAAGALQPAEAPEVMNSHSKLPAVLEPRGDLQPTTAAMAPPPLPPLARNPVEEGRRLFNGKGACHTCHGRDADMYTDVQRDPLLGVEPGYIPPIIAPFGPSPRRVAPNLRDWFSLRIRTDLELYRAIKNGIGGSTMTGTRHLSDREISDLIAYLNSLR